jgi:hypothetical protein
MRSVSQREVYEIAKIRVHNMKVFSGSIGAYKAYLCAAFSLQACPVLLRFSDISFFTN